jgi:hypothetical protein
MRAFVLAVILVILMTLGGGEGVDVEAKVSLWVRVQSQFFSSAPIFGKIQLSYSYSPLTQVRNYAGVPIDVFWKADDGRLVSQSNSFIRNGTKFIISSFPTHKFVFALHGDETDRGGGDDGFDAEVVMARHNMKSIITLTDDGRLVADTSTEATRRQSALESDLSTCRMEADDKTTSTAFETCVVKAVSNQVSILSTEKETLRHYRDEMGDKMSDYLCRDEDGDHTVDKIVKGSNGQKIRLGGAGGQRSITVHTVVNTEGNKVYVADDFISEEECNELISGAQPSLQKATEYKGGKTAGNRKADAQSFFYSAVDFQDDRSVLDFGHGATIYQKVHELVNKLTGYNMDIDGQEGISVLRYLPGDYYKPHCDGSCNSDKGNGMRTGARVATALMYCRSADVGGSTIFPNVGVSVPVKPGRVLLFTYGGEAFEYSGLFQGVQDPNGFSRHAGCPILEGEKWMATAWWRYGVHHDDAWSSYDAHGAPLGNT